MLPNCNILTLADPICHPCQQVSAPTDLLSSLRTIPRSALPIWVSRPCILMLFEGSGDPCRVLVTMPSCLVGSLCALSPLPYWRCHSSVLLLPALLLNQGLLTRRLGHTAVHVSQALRRRGLVWSPSPATCQRRGGTAEAAASSYLGKWGQHRENKPGNELTQTGFA